MTTEFNDQLQDRLETQIAKAAAALEIPDVSNVERTEYMRQIEIMTRTIDTLQKIEHRKAPRTWQ